MCDHYDRYFPEDSFAQRTINEEKRLEKEMQKGFRHRQSTSLKDRYTGEPVGESNAFGEWQVCPKCNGSGKAMNFNNQIPMPTDTCDVCLGDKIIVRPLL